MAEECDIDTDLLIFLVKQRPLLWDRNKELYKNRIATKNSWYQIAMTLKPDLMENGEEIPKLNFCKQVLKRWTHLRDNYHKSNKRIQEHIQSGNVSKLPKRYIYSKKLSFLLKNAALETPTLTKNLAEGSSDSENENSDDFYENDDAVSVKSLKYENERSLTFSELTRLEGASESGSKNEVENNRHLSFFNGIIPSLEDFDEDEVLEFQLGVLQLLKSIKRTRLKTKICVEDCDPSDFSIKNEQIDVD